MLSPLERKLVAIIGCYCLCWATMCEIPSWSDAVDLETRRLLSQNQLLQQFRYCYSHHLIKELFSSPWEHSSIGLKPLGMIQTVSSSIPSTQHDVFLQILQQEAQKDPTIMSIVKHKMDKLSDQHCSVCLKKMMVSLGIDNHDHDCLIDDAIEEYNTLFRHINTHQFKIQI